MKRFTGLLHRTKSSQSGTDFHNLPADSPEANASRSVRLFCESGGPSNHDEEVLHLPVIVESCESSPQAASASSHQIRKFLTKDFGGKPHVQYNAIMLIRILSDNPGPTFTRCFDEKFVRTVKECLKNCRDQSVQQLLRETLDNFEVNKGFDEGLQGLLMMWRKEKGGGASLSRGQGSVGSSRHNSGQAGHTGGAGSPPPLMHQHSQGHRALSRNQLPPQYELASRIEEAKNTAKILLQLLQTTPPEETMQNELLREFSERCQSAQRSMQVYINCDSPAPDHDTLQTLIETNEQLSLAQSRHQRAVLAARRAMGSSTSPNMEAMQDGTGAFAGPPAPGQRESMAGAGAVLAQRSSNGWGGPEGPGAGMAWGTQKVSPQEYQSPSQRAQSNGWGSESGSNDYQSPPGLPPVIMNTFQAREQPPPQPSTQLQQQQQRQPGYSPTAYNSYDPSHPESPTTFNGFPSQSQIPTQPHQPPYQPQNQPASDPFADPHEYAANPAPLVSIDQTPPTHTFPQARRPNNAALSTSARRNTYDLENAYTAATPSPPAQPQPPAGPLPSQRTPTRTSIQPGQFQHHYRTPSQPQSPPQRQYPTQDYHEDHQSSYQPSLHQLNQPSNAVPSPTSPNHPSEPKTLGPASATLPPQTSSPPQPQRPGPGPWHNSTITPSFVNRQHEALEGVTMHGADSPTTPGIGAPPPTSPGGGRQSLPSQQRRAGQGLGGVISDANSGSGSSGGAGYETERIGPGTRYELDHESGAGRSSEDLYAEGGFGRGGPRQRGGIGGGGNRLSRVDVGGTGGLRGFGGR